jgi:hypothetical protein
MQDCHQGVPEEVTTKMIGYLPNSLKLVNSTSEFLEEKVRIGHNTSQMHHQHRHKTIHTVCQNLSSKHQDLPYRIETHIHKSVSKEVMPSGSTGSKSIESLDNDE